MKRTVSGNRLILEGGNRSLEGRSKSLEIETEMKDDTAVMKLSGSVTAELQSELLDEILAFISVGKSVQMNFQGLEHIANTAQQKLIEIQSEYVEKAGLSLEICGVSPRMYAMFRSSKLDTQLRIRQDV